MYVFEDPEPNGEVEQDSMMDYRTLHENVEVCVYLHTVIFIFHTIMDFARIIKA